MILKADVTIVMRSVVSTAMKATTAAEGIPSSRTRLSSMMIDMEAINTTRKQLSCEMTDTAMMDTVEMNTETNTETIVSWMMPRDGRGIR